MNTPFFVVITGPTGVGKSDLAIKLAECMQGEIINCDVGQFYTPLSIGTAKPDWRHEKVPHHLFDILDEPCNFSVTDYRLKAQAVIADICRRGKLPIVVGGSGFYVNSLFYPPVSPHGFDTACGLLTMDGENRGGVSACPPKLYAKAGNHANGTTENIPSSWDTLNAIDPLRAAHIDPHDHYRIERALSLWRQTGMLPSRLIPQFDPIGRAFILHVTRDRDDLYTRINGRTGIMLHAGWIQEVAALDAPWREFLRIKKIIGYAEIVAYIEKTQQPQFLSDQLEAQLRDVIQQKTRNYAKRQLTFWRYLQKKLQNNGCQTHEINLTLLDLDLYLEQLITTIEAMRNPL